MDFTNLKNGIGFVNRQDVFDRLVRFRPPISDYYRVSRIKNSAFSEVCIMCHGSAMYPLFKIYTGNEELYQFVCGLLEDVAKQFEHGFKADKWEQPC